MPSKKKKYNARFPPARIKKIMQTDEDVGKVAAAVPVIISRALEMFIESLITKTNATTQSRNAKTLTTQHIKQTILIEKEFDFLKDLVEDIPDVSLPEEECGETSQTQPVERPPGSRPRGRPRKKKPEGEVMPPRKRRVQIKAAEPPEDDSETEDADSDVGDSDEGSDDTSSPTQSVGSAALLSPVTMTTQLAPVGALISPVPMATYSVPVEPMVSPVTMATQSAPAAPLLSPVSMVTQSNPAGPQLPPVSIATHTEDVPLVSPVTVPVTTAAFSGPSVSPVAMESQSVSEAPAVSPVAIAPQSAHEVPRVSPVAMASQSAPEAPRVSPVAMASQSAPEAPRVSPVAMASQSAPEAPIVSPVAMASHSTPPGSSVSPVAMDSQSAPGAPTVSPVAMAAHSTPPGSSVSPVAMDSQSAPGAPTVSPVAMAAPEAPTVSPVAMTTHSTPAAGFLELSVSKDLKPVAPSVSPVAMATEQRQAITSPRDGPKPPLTTPLALTRAPVAHVAMTTYANAETLGAHTSVDSCMPLDMSAKSTRAGQAADLVKGQYKHYSNNSAGHLPRTFPQAPMSRSALPYGGIGSMGLHPSLPFPPAAHAHFPPHAQGPVTMPHMVQAPMPGHGLPGMHSLHAMQGMPGMPGLPRLPELPPHMYPPYMPMHNSYLPPGRVHLGAGMHGYMPPHAMPGMPGMPVLPGMRPTAASSSKMDDDYDS